MMRAAVLLLALAALSGCGDPPPSKHATDQCLRAQLFAQCMAALPKGPEVVGTSHDWSEVVSECGDAAYYQAQRARATIKPDCAL